MNGQKDELIVEAGYYIISGVSWERGQTEVEDFRTGSITKTSGTTYVQNPCDTRFNRKTMKLEFVNILFKSANSVFSYINTDGSVDRYTDIINNVL